MTTPYFVQLSSLYDRSIGVKLWSISYQFNQSRPPLKLESDIDLFVSWAFFGQIFIVSGNKMSRIWLFLTLKLGILLVVNNSVKHEIRTANFINDGTVQLLLVFYILL